MARDVFWSAFVGSDNLGDEAIFSSLLYNLRIDTQHIAVTTVNPEKTYKKAGGIKAIDARNPLAIYRSIKQAKVVLMGGGGIIQDQSSLLNFLYFAYQIALAKKFKTPVILNFVGVGPLNKRTSRYILRRIGSIVSLAVVRDVKSKNEISPYLKPGVVHVAHDPVLNFPIVRKNKLGQQAPYIVVSIRRWFFSIPLLPAKLARKLNSLGIARRNYDRFVVNTAKGLDSFLQDHPSVRLRFASFYDSEDVEVINDVRKQMEESLRTEAPLQDLTESDYTELVGGALFMVGMRFHSLILAAIEGTPFVAISYSPKVSEFARTAGLEHFTLDVNQLDPEVMASKCAEMYDESVSYGTKLAAKVEAFQQDNDIAFSLIREQVALAIGRKI